MKERIYDDQYMLTKKFGNFEIVIAVREEPLAKLLSQKQKEARLEILMQKYGVKLL